MQFERKILTRYNNKKNDNVNRKCDRNGHEIQFLLSLSEFTELFIPYKDDLRFYDHTNTLDYLCLSRIDDLGDYVVVNVFVSTMSQNSVDARKITKHRNFSHAESIKGSVKSKELYPNGTMFGKKHKSEFFDKQSKSFKFIGHAQGEKNSQFGTCWIYNLTDKMSRKIPKEDLSDWESLGWIKGRKMF